MSDASEKPIRYRVSYSGRVREAALELTERARQRGLEAVVIAALKDIDYRLRVDPQFGDSHRDLVLESAKSMMGVVPPLVVRCWLNDDLRLVLVGTPIVPMPHSGLDP